MRRRSVALAALAAAALLVAAVAALYQRDIRAARARIAEGGRVAHTPCGAIQYAERGQGVPMLVIHGAGGGFDQGLEFMGALAGRGVRIISVSRFGYLGTPLPADASAAAQARAHACLLDALGLPAAAIFGGSAGAPSAMRFAILYPGRTTHLVLAVPAAHAPRAPGETTLTPQPETRALFDTALRWDFLFWAAIRAAPGLVTRAILATPPELVRNAEASERERVRRVMEAILPIAPRRLGLLNDAAITERLPRYELEKIEAPTLVVTARDDLFGTWEGARYTADNIRGARFVGHETGGHLLVGHEAAQRELVASFIGAAR